MPWFKVDDGFHSHPKVMPLSPEAVGVWTLAGSWSANYLTDGEVHANIVRRFGGTSEAIQELVDADLWLDNGDGTYQFKDWSDYQPVKADVEAERAAARERMRQVRAQKKGIKLPPKGAENVQANTSRTSEEVRVTPTQSQSLSQSPPVVSRSVRLPDGWHPRDAHKKFAAENNLDIEIEAANFRDHAQANDRRQKDWDAAFRMWLRKSTEFQARRPQQPQQHHMTASQRRLQEGYEREQRILNGELNFDNTDNPYLQPRQPRQAIEGGTTWTPEQP